MHHPDQANNRLYHEIDLNYAEMNFVSIYCIQMDKSNDHWVDLLYKWDEMKSAMAYFTFVREQMTEACVIQIFFTICLSETFLSQFFLHP